MAEPSKTQIDYLGNRLKKGPVVKDDVVLLDSYRRSFGQTYEMVVHTIRDKLNLEVSGRPAKSTNSIIDKLKREHIRLTQMQDIAGCRVVVSNSIEQDRVVCDLIEMFSQGQARLVDRRETPTFGYRAVHVIVSDFGKVVEVQVRTRLQHVWAEISEKYADLFGSEIKYGGGEQGIREFLNKLSHEIDEHEKLELRIANLDSPELRKKLAEMNESLLNLLADLLHGLQNAEGT